MNNNRKSEITEQIKKTKTIKWHRIYYLLAFFDVLIVVFGLFLNHHLISVQRESVSDNEIWVNRLDKYLAFRGIANKVSQPGDDVFASQDPVLERQNMERNLITYNREFKGLFDQINDVPPRFRENLFNDLNRIDGKVQAMAVQCRKIFDYYEKGDTKQAGAEMAEMDHMLGEVNENLSVLHSNVIQIQHDLLTEESDYVSGVQRYEFVTAAFVLLMVTVAILYGSRIKKRIDEAAREQEKNIKLEAANDFITNVVGSMADMMITVDDNGLIVNINDAVLNQMGYEENELIGQPIKILTQKEVFLSEKEFELLKSNRKLVETEKDFVRKNGKIFRCLVSASILNNFKTAAVVVAKDISRRLEDERKLRNYANKLQQSNRELEDFAYVASHDLQEPLRKVQAFGDRLDRKYSQLMPEEGRDYIHRMRDAAVRMQRLINDLLTFSRVTTKAQPFQEVNVKKITEEVISDLEVRIEETKAKVEVGDLPQIDADPVQIRQLMQNLIGNALKFHQTTQSPHIKIYSEDFSHNSAAFSFNGETIQTAGSTDKFCQIIVQDNGIGFDEKYLDRIFTVFQRLHGRTEYEGSGVGLAVCRKIVERHNGTITAQSKEGDGAKFLITLPIIQEETINNEAKL